VKWRKLLFQEERVVYQVYVDENDGDTDEVISIQSPALLTLLLDVAHVQVRSIAAALIERLGAA
jgi:hypothetical protein